MKTLLSLAVYPLIFPEPRQSKKKRYRLGHKPRASGPLSPTPFLAAVQCPNYSPNRAVVEITETDSFLWENEGMDLLRKPAEQFLCLHTQENMWSIAIIKSNLLAKMYLVVTWWLHVQNFFLFLWKWKMNEIKVSKACLIFGIASKSSRWKTGINF